MPIGATTFTVNSVAPVTIIPVNATIATVAFVAFRSILYPKTTVKSCNLLILLEIPTKQHLSLNIGC